MLSYKAGIMQKILMKKFFKAILLTLPILIVLQDVSYALSPTSRFKPITDSEEQLSQPPAAPAQVGTVFPSASDVLKLQKEPDSDLRKNQETKPIVRMGGQIDFGPSLLSEQEQKVIVAIRNYSITNEDIQERLFRIGALLDASPGAAAYVILMLIKQLTEEEGREFMVMSIDEIKNLFNQLSDEEIILRLKELGREPAEEDRKALVIKSKYPINEKIYSPGTIPLKEEAFLRYIGIRKPLSQATPRRPAEEALIVPIFFSGENLGALNHLLFDKILPVFPDKFFEIQISSADEWNNAYGAVDWKNMEEVAELISIALLVSTGVPLLLPPIEKTFEPVSFVFTTVHPACVNIMEDKEKNYHFPAEHPIMKNSLAYLVDIWRMLPYLKNSETYKEYYRIPKEHYLVAERGDIKDKPIRTDWFLLPAYHRSHLLGQDEQDVSLYPKIIQDLFDARNKKDFKAGLVKYFGELIQASSFRNLHAGKLMFSGHIWPRRFAQKEGKRYDQFMEKVWDERGDLLREHYNGLSEIVKSLKKFSENSAIRQEIQKLIFLTLEKAEKKISADVKTAQALEGQWDGPPREGTDVLKLQKGPDSDLRKNQETKPIVRMGGQIRPRILIVEDMKVWREKYKELLSKWGYEPEFAEYGRKAVEIFRENPAGFALVISDLDLNEELPEGVKDMPGEEVISEVRKIHAKIPIIVISAWNYTGDPELINHDPILKSIFKAKPEILLKVLKEYFYILPATNKPPKDKPEEKRNRDDPNLSSAALPIKDVSKENEVIPVSPAAPAQVETTKLAVELKDIKKGLREKLFAMKEAREALVKILDEIIKEGLFPGGFVIRKSSKNTAKGAPIKKLRSELTRANNPEDQKAIIAEVNFTMGAIRRIISETQNKVKDDEMKDILGMQRRYDEIRNELVKENQGLVETVVKDCLHKLGKKWKKANDLSDELSQTGNIGLISAIERFDPGQGFEFSTYAVPAISRAIERMLKQRLVEIPQHLWKEKSEIDKFIAEFTQIEKREPTVEEVAAGLNLPVSRVENIFRAFKKPVSLENPFDGEDEESPLSRLEYPSDREMKPPSEDALIIKEKLEQALQILSKREREVIELRYGLDGNGERVLREVGKILNISRERVRQIESKALRKLRGSGLQPKGSIPLSRKDTNRQVKPAASVAGKGKTSPPPGDIFSKKYMVKELSNAKNEALKNNQEEEKRLAAQGALDYLLRYIAAIKVEDRAVVIGLGSGTTMKHFIGYLGVALKEGKLKNIIGVSTSKEIEKLAGENSVPLSNLENNPVIDIYFDGADELNIRTLYSLKSGGGALTKEKEVMNKSKRVVILVDSTKLVEHTASKSPLYIEIKSPDSKLQDEIIKELRAIVPVNEVKYSLSGEGKHILAVDISHHELHKYTQSLPDIEEKINKIRGVIDSGIFTRAPDVVIIGRKDKRADIVEVRKNKPIIKGDSAHNLAKEINDITIYRFTFIQIAENPTDEIEIDEEIVKIKEEIGGLFDQDKNIIFTPPFLHKTFTLAMLDTMFNNSDSFKGATVVDFGAGDGVLSIVALGLGAKQVILVEKNKAQLEKAKIFLESNGWRKDADFFIMPMDFAQVEFIEKIKNFKPTVALINIGLWVEYGNSNGMAVSIANLLPEVNLILNGGYHFELTSDASDDQPKSEFSYMQHHLETAGFTVSDSYYPPYSIHVLTAKRLPVFTKAANGENRDGANLSSAILLAGNAPIKAPSSLKSVGAEDSRDLKPFFKKHELGFQNRAAVIIAVRKLKELIIDIKAREGVIYAEIGELNKTFPNGEIEIEKKVEAGAFQCSEKEYKYAVFHFKKEKKTINVLFLEDHTALTPAELAELRIQDIEKRRLDCPGLEGVWFINPDAANAKSTAEFEKLPSRDALEKEIDRIHDENFKYMPTIPEKTILCHIIVDSILPEGQRALLKVLEQNMRDQSYSEKVASLTVNKPDKFIPPSQNPALKGRDGRGGISLGRMETPGFSPESFIDQLRALMARQRELYKDYTVNFDVACPNTDLVAAILGANLGIKALAFEPCKEADVAQVEGIILALRALNSGKIETLREAFKILAGKELPWELSGIADINEFIKRITFILPAAKVIDYSHISRLNEIIRKNIEAAA